LGTGKKSQSKDLESLLHLFCNENGFLNKFLKIPTSFVLWNLLVLQHLLWYALVIQNRNGHPLIMPSFTGQICLSAVLCCAGRFAVEFNVLS